jgi:outer membrane protein assembly factor BamB
MKKIPISLVIATMILIAGIIVPVYSNLSKDDFKKYNAKGQGLADSPWPMYQGDRRHTGQSPYDTSHVNGSLAWKYEAGGWLNTAPTIGMDRTIYIGSTDSNLYAISYRGDIKWAFKTNGGISSTPAIDNNGIIYFGSRDTSIYALNSDGTLKWKYATEGDIDSSPVIGNDGTIYVLSDDQHIYALYNNGTLKWKYRIHVYSNTSPAIGRDGIIFVCSYWNLYAFYPNGTLKWDFKPSSSFGGSVSLLSSPSIADTGIIYVCTSSLNPRLLAIFPNGKLIWSYKLEESTWTTPAIGNDGTIYIGTPNGYVYAFHNNRSLRWKIKIPNAKEIYFNDIVIGGDGTLYFGSGNNKVYGLNPDGTIKWEYKTGHYISASPSIGSDGTVYIGSWDGFLYAFGEKKDGNGVENGNIGRPESNGIDYLLLGILTSILLIVTIILLTISLIRKKKPDILPTKAPIPITCEGCGKTYTIVYINEFMSFSCPYCGARGDKKY